MKKKLKMCSSVDQRNVDGARMFAAHCKVLKIPEEKKEKVKHVAVFLLVLLLHHFVIFDFHSSQLCRRVKSCYPAQACLSAPVFAYIEPVCCRLVGQSGGM